jgi:hypothetical protein
VLAAGYGETSVFASWRRDLVRGDPWAFDRLALGGSGHSVSPESSGVAHIWVPSLPTGTLLGTDHEAQRLALTLAGGALPVFWQRHRVWEEDGGRGEWLALAGLAWELDADPLPLVGFPGFTLQLGVARILDEPLKGRTHWWLGLRWRP